MQRPRLLILPGLIAISLYLLLTNFEAVVTESAVDSETLNLDFDAYAEGITTVLYDASGAINYTLQADRQIHYNDDSTELQSPFIRLFQDGSSQWHIVANSGRISPELVANQTQSRTIELSGDVEIVSLDEFGNRTIMSTQTLTVHPESETLVTDQPVTLVTTNIQQTAIGMVADLIANEIFFEHTIRGNYAESSN